MYLPFIHETVELKSLVLDIRKQFKLDALYCLTSNNTNVMSRSILYPEKKFFTQKNHYCLLVLAEHFPSNFIADTSETIHQKSQETVSVTLLTYHTAATQQPGEHQWLLHNIMTKGFRLYRRRSKRALLRCEEPPLRNHEHLEKQWQHRKYMAICFLEAETAIENPNGNTPQTVLLHAALEQLCLGLIYVFLGHQAASFGLNYLLRLCDIFTPLATEVFPDRTTEDKRILKVLSANNSTLRHRPQTKTSITDVEILRNRVHNFKKAACNLAEEHLIQIKTYNQTETNKPLQ